MATMTAQGTLPVAGADMLAAPVTDTFNHIMNTYNGKNIDTNNVDTTSSNGIMDLPTAQTATGAKTIKATFTVGEDATGHDVQFHGDTTAKSMLWDESADTLIIAGKQTISETLGVTGVATLTATSVHTGGITSGSNIVSDTDSTDDLGTTGTRWANLFVDDITLTTALTAGGAGTFASLSVSDGNITNVGDIALDSITSDGSTITIGTGSTLVFTDNTTIAMTLGDDAGDDFLIDATAFVVEGDSGNIGQGTAAPTSPSGFAPIYHIKGAAPGFVFEDTTGANLDFEIGVNAGKMQFTTETASATVMSLDQAGLLNLTSLTASQDVQTDGSKNLTSVSDMNWKNDLGEISGAIEIINQIPARYFNWKKDSNGDIPTEDEVLDLKTKQNVVTKRPPQPRLAGFFAQEIYSVFPEGSPGGANIDSDGNEHWGLNSRAILALVLAGQKELDARLLELEK